MKKLLAVAAICSFAAVWADEKPKATEKKAPAGMTMPKPGPEARELRGLLGTWNTNETFEKVEGMMPEGGEGTSVETVTPGPGGFSIVMHVKGMTGPMGPYRGMAIIAWSAEDKAYKMAWVDSMTAGLLLETGHKQGNDLVFEGEMSMMGKKYKTRDVISDRTPTTYTLTSYSDDGSGEKKMMTLKATKEETKTTKSESK